MFQKKLENMVHDQTTTKLLPKKTESWNYCLARILAIGYLFWQEPFFEENYPFSSNLVV